MRLPFSIFPRKLGIETSEQALARVTRDRDYWRDRALRAEHHPVAYDPEQFRQAVRDGEVT